jgi:hypothetical protein
MLLLQVDQRILKFDVGFLSGDFERAVTSAREKNFGMLNEAKPINLSLLHRSTKTKSGFVGVYANGKGFRAMVTSGESMHSIGTFPSAEEAAWRRREHYLSNGLPYGELEIEMERWRKGELGTPFKGTDAQLIEEIKKHALNAGTYDEIFALSRHEVTTPVAPTRNAEPKPIGIDDAAADEIFGGD